MRKIAALSLTLIMAISVSGMVYASEINQDTTPQTSTAIISASVAPTYSVTIPGNTTVNYDRTSTSFGTVKLNQAKLDLNHVVKVELNASGTLKNGDDPEKTIPYVIKEKASGEIFTSSVYSDAGQSTDLTIDITKEDWEAAYPGDYSDTVTLTVSYESVNP